MSQTKYQKNKNVPTDISEEYYQIAIEILTSFPKYRPPVDLFIFKEDICVLSPYSRKGDRLSNERIEEVRKLCNEGHIFVSRSDHPIYSEHIINQLDLVLQDANLKDGEIADICTRAVIIHYEEFIQQPVKAVFENLYKAIMVVTEWLWGEQFRIKYFVRRMSNEKNHGKHAFNCMAMGLWLWMQCNGSYRRRALDRAAIAFLLHDLGMTKIPDFILTKPKPLTMEEKEKMVLHTLMGVKMMQKLELAFDEVTQAIMEHHERLNGTGYPQKIRGRQMSEMGKMCAIIDSFVAMISIRPYAKPKTVLEAAKELSNNNEAYDQKMTAKLLNAIANGDFGHHFGEFSNATKK